MNKYAIKQLSIFVENRAGELTDITTQISQNNISLKSINLVDANETFVFNGIDSDICSKEVGLEVRDVPAGVYTLEVPLSTIGFPCTISIRLWSGWLWETVTTSGLMLFGRW